MKPQLNIQVFSKKINSFHFFGIIGYLLGLLLGVFLATQLQLSIITVILMGLISATSFFLLAYLVKIILGKENIVYYHQEVVISIMCSLVLYLLKQPILPYLDIMILGIGLFLALGRIGCYSVGCCHGKPCKHGVKYGEDHVNAGFTWYYKNVKLFPIQLVEALFAALVVFIGSYMMLNKILPGTVFLFYSLIYALFRFFIEFFRGDPERPVWMGASEAQWTSVFIILLLILMSNYGWFPKYSWHIIITIFLLFSLLAITITYYFKSVLKLTSHKHIHEIAIGVSFLNEHPKILPYCDEDEDRVNIFKTSEGFSFSRGVHDNKSCFYTISYKKKLNKNTVTKIAKILKVLNGRCGGFIITNTKSSVYHILYKNNEDLMLNKMNSK